MSSTREILDSNDEAFAENRERGLQLLELRTVRHLQEPIDLHWSITTRTQWVRSTADSHRNKSTLHRLSFA